MLSSSTRSLLSRRASPRWATATRAEAHLVVTGRGMVEMCDYWDVAYPIAPLLLLFQQREICYRIKPYFFLYSVSYMDLISSVMAAATPAITCTNRSESKVQCSECSPRWARPERKRGGKRGTGISLRGRTEFHCACFQTLHPQNIPWAIELTLSVALVLSLSPSSVVPCNFKAIPLVWTWLQQSNLKRRK